MATRHRDQDTRPHRQRDRRLTLAAGRNVVLSNSRAPETLADLGDHARAATPAEAAQTGDRTTYHPARPARHHPLAPQQRGSQTRSAR
ncbi:hypothetical protein DMB66_38690 [Actinoplanes sp. ATCC 53533]|nr:hypothetical protein DMB66_38690 [Actinoplanes sp. ATCC 53533]